MKYSGSHQYRQSNINESEGIFPSGSENGEKRSKQDIFSLQILKTVVMLQGKALTETPTSSTQLLKSSA